MKLQTTPLASAVLCALITGCASAPLALRDLQAKPPVAAPAPSAPLSWQAPLPHAGSPQALSQWWAQFNDPLLNRLIAEAQSLSPSLAAARARVAQAQAQLAAARSALGPSAGAQLSAERSTRPGQPVVSTLQAGVQAQWELDVFGDKAQGVDGATAGVQSSQAAWHEARVSLAADVARLYFGLRLCEQQVALLQADLASRTETQRLSKVTAQAGFLAPATLALGDASLAEGQSRVNAQALACGGLANGLTALSAVPAQDLMSKPPSVQSKSSFDATKSLAVPPLAMPKLPADLLRQRPDVYQAERAVLQAASAVVGADAALKPRISLNGTLGFANSRASGFNQDGAVWSLGPISFTMPLLATESLKSQAAASRVNFEATQVAYRATLRQAVREAEDALASLHSVAERAGLNDTAAKGYRAHFTATQAKHRAGLASLVELEDARRITLAADNAVLALEQERVAAWINLYRAAGGGWQLADNASAPGLSAAAPNTSTAKN